MPSQALQADERTVSAAFGRFFDQLWTALYPAEQARIIQLLVGRVTVGAGGIAVDLRTGWRRSPAT